MHRAAIRRHRAVQSGAVLLLLAVLAGPGLLRHAAAGASGGDSARVTDLLPASPHSETMKLRWTAPPAAGGGPAAAYDLRYSTCRLDERSGDSREAVHVSIERRPAPPGSPDECEVKGLRPATAYYFMLRSSDAAGRWSAASNVVKATTLPRLEGRDAFVSPSGSDTTGDGSRENPYRTIARAASSRGAGDTVRVLAGVYLKDKAAPRSGTALVSEDGPGRAIIDGEGRVQHLLSLWGKSDVVVDGLELRNAGGNAKDANDVIWIDGKGKGVGSRNITLRNLRVHGAGLKGDCIKVTNNVEGFVLEDSVVWGPYAVEKGESEECLDMKITRKALIRGNWFFHEPGAFGNGLTYSKTDSSDIVYEENVFGPQSPHATDATVGGGWSSSSAGPNTDRLTIRNNLFVDCPFAAVGAYGARNERILNNVFYNCGRKGGGIFRCQEGGKQKASEAVALVNNIVIDTDGEMGRVYYRQSIAPLNGFEHHHNLFWNAGRPAPREGHADPTAEEGSSVADPRFLDPGPPRDGETREDVFARFTPRPGSPALGGTGNTPARRGLRVRCEPPGDDRGGRAGK